MSTEILLTPAVANRVRNLQAQITLILQVVADQWGTSGAPYTVVDDAQGMRLRLTSEAAPPADAPSAS